MKFSTNISSPVSFPLGRYALEKRSMDFTLGHLPAGVQFTRDSTGTATNNEANIVNFTNNIARFNYKYNSTISLWILEGLLVEEQRTNKCLYSELPSQNGTWIGDSYWTTDNAEVAPDGVSGIDYVSMPDATQIRIYDITAAAFVVYDDITITTTPTRFSTTFTTGASTTSIRLYSFRNSSGNPSGWQVLSVDSSTEYTVSFWAWENSAGTQMYSWGFQLEESSAVSSYIPTEGSQVTRALDSAKILDLDTIGFNPTAGTVIMEFDASKAANPDGWPIAFSFNDGTTNNVIEAFITANGGSYRASAYMKDGGVVVADTSSWGYAIMDKGNNKIALAWDENGIVAACNGTLGSEDISITIPTVTQFNIANRLDTHVFNSAEKNIEYYPTKLSDAQLRAKTWNINQVAQPITVWMGDSITAATQGLSFIDWANTYTSGQLKHVVGYNQGVSGNHITDMIARDSTALALNPELYMILAGTNDAGAGLSASTITTNLATLIHNALHTNSVRYVGIGTILNRDTTPTFNAVIAEVNEWIRTRQDSRIIPIDYDLSTFDYTIHTDDGLHPNAEGAKIIGEYAASVLLPYLDIEDPLADNDIETNLIANPTFTGTGGSFANMTGDVADDWIISNYTGLTGVASITDEAQTVILNGTTSAGYIQFANNIAYSGVTGEEYEALIQVDISNMPEEAQFKLLSDGVIQLGSFSAGVEFGINGTFSKTLRTGRAALAGNDTSARFEFTLRVPAGVAVSDLEITISKPRWGKVG